MFALPILSLQAHFPTTADAEKKLVEILVASVPCVIQQDWTSGTVKKADPAFAPCARLPVHQTGGSIGVRWCR